MSFKDTLNRFFFKKSEPSDKPSEVEKIDSENPYLTSRRTWNNIMSGLVSSRDTTRLAIVLALLIALAAVGGMAHIGSQSKFIPYVIEVDKLGQSAAVSIVTRASPVDQRVIHSAVASFISDARLVSPDVALLRKAVLRVYSMLAQNDPATAKMNEWMNSTPDANPFERAKKETVSIEILSVLPQTSETWQIDWTETVRDRQGVVIGQPSRMRALVTVFVVNPTTQTTEEQIRNNPMGIYVRDFSWSKLI